MCVLNQPHLVICHTLSVSTDSSVKLQTLSGCSRPDHGNGGRPACLPACLSGTLTPVGIECVCTEDLSIRSLDHITDELVSLHYLHITDELVSLHYLYILGRIQYKIEVLTYNVLQGFSLRCLGPFVCVSNLPVRCSLRSANTSRLVVPPFKLSTIGGQTVKAAAAQT